MRSSDRPSRLAEHGNVLSGRTVIVSLLVGVGITMLATISPARRATRAAPIAAVREGATLPTSRFAGSPVTATVVLAVAVVALAFGLIPDGLATGLDLLLVGLGCLLLFVGVGLVASRLVARSRPPLGSARRASRRDPRPARAGELDPQPDSHRPYGRRTDDRARARHLVVTLGASLKSTDRTALEDQVRSDYVVTSKNGYDPFTSSAGEAVARAPGVAVASSVRTTGRAASAPTSPSPAGALDHRQRL